MEFKAALDNLGQELAEVEKSLSDPTVIGNQNLFRQLSMRHAELQPILETYDAYLQAEKQRDEASEMIPEADDDEMREFLEAEREQAAATLVRLQEQLTRMLVPRDPADAKNAVVEIRAGTGGDEAALFAGDLCTMYTRYAELKGYKTTVLDATESEMGGYKEIVFSVEGAGAYGVLRYESGVHRVQRVPETESQGRIHTSAATVAVLPEVEDIEFDLDPNDLEIVTFRAGGPGGQHMQKNDTAVRITHKPTGVSVSCTNERSQRQNREKALQILRGKLYEAERRKQQEDIAASRKSQIGTGDRSEKIRTYNFPQDRLTDHRIGLTMHNLPAILAGEIDPLIEALAEAHYQDLLATAAAAEPPE